MDNEKTNPPAGSATPPPAPPPAPVPAPAPAPAGAPDSSGPETATARKKVLMIDDEATFARMVKLNLERTGAFEVRTETVALSALAAAREFKPDIILLDVIMPSMDGGDVANQIKRDRTLRGTPIIFLTATVSKRESGDGGLNSGGELFLAKPVSLETLIHCINERTRKPEASTEQQAP